MKFFNLVTMALASALLILNSGCQVISVGKEASQNEQSPADLSKQEQAVATLPNPYLQGRSPVPVTANKRFQLAKQAMRDKNWSQAQQHLEWLIKSYPMLSGPYLNLALLFRQLKQNQEAESAFKKAIAVNSNNVSAYNQYAIFLREQGRFTDAKAVYLKALEIWPDHPESHRNLGILYDLFMGKPAEALPFYKRYQSLLATPDRAVAGWIVDTERRVQQRGQTQ